MSDYIQKVLKRMASDLGLVIEVTEKDEELSIAIFKDGEKDKSSRVYSGYIAADNYLLGYADAKQTQVQATSKKRRAKAKQAVTMPEDVSPDLWEKWMQVRKQKRMIMTDGVIDFMRREAKAYGISLAQAVQICVDRGWGGFKADYMTNTNFKVVGGYGAPQTIDQFKQGCVDMAERIRASGMIDDIE